MTSPSLNVVPTELAGRANEIVAALPRWPEEEPKALCELDAAKNAAIALQEAADVILDSLGQGQRRWQALAQAVMGAANAYEAVDEDSADSITSGNPGSAADKYGIATSLKFDKLVPVSSRDYTRLRETVYHSQARNHLKATAGYNEFEFFNFDNWSDHFFETQYRTTDNTTLDSKFADVKTVARMLETGNRDALNNFRYEWSEYEKQLRKLTERFRRFVDWESEASNKVEQHFSRHAELLRNLASLCRKLSENAQAVTEAYDVACADHPKLAVIEGIYAKLRSRLSEADYNAEMAKLEALQKKSQEVLTAYRKAANLAPLDKTSVPDRVDGNLFLTTEQISERNRKKAQEQAKSDAEASVQDFLDGSDAGAYTNAAAQDALAKSAGAGNMRAPSLPSPQKLMSAMSQAANQAKQMGQSKPLPGGAGAGIPSPDLQKPSVAPAAFHGGGGGSSIGGGVGATPLQPPSLPGGGPGGAPGTAPASFTQTAAGAGAHGGAAGGAGGGMGGAPMGGMGSKGQDGAGKGKRLGDDDEALYTEDRAWTEGIIGITPRKLGP